MKKRGRKVVNKRSSKNNTRQLIVGGEYKCEGGANLKLKQIGNIVKGRFAKIGKIHGELKGDTLTGYWYGDCTEKCPEGKGRIIFKFNNNGENFDGRWAYGDGEFIKKWVGRKIVGVKFGDTFDASGMWSSSWGNLSINHIGNKISIKSEDKKVKISGTISKDTFNGQWIKYSNHIENKGNIELKFTYEEDNFSGKWGYINEGLNQRINGFKLGEVKKNEYSLPPGGDDEEIDFKLNQKVSDINGVWQIIEGFWTNITFSKDGNKLSGTYDSDNGIIEGKIENNLFKGYWKEGPTYNCPDCKGKMELEFSLDSNSFEGKWNYCEEIPKTYIKGIKIK